MPAALSPRTRRSLGLAALLAGCQVEPGPRPAAEYAEDLADDIPMTGDASPLFAEVDIAMRQFMKWRCVGAGTLAISYKGRRVYKRGFGRMHGRASEILHPGCGDDAQNPFDPDAALVEPDTPMYLGSVSKPIGAAIVRWLLGERLAARPELVPPPCEGPLCSCDEPPCPGTAADVRLLDPAADLLPAGLAAILRGDVPLPVSRFEEPCSSGHDLKYADPRWRDITVGNLLSHQSGLTRDGGAAYFGEDGPIANMAALRGYGEADEAPWIAEDAFVRAANSVHGPAIDAAAVWLSERNDGAPVYFVNRYNAIAGERPLDEFIKNEASTCLEYSPGATGMFTDEDGLYAPIGQDGMYSNFNFMLVGRVIDHLQQARSGGLYHAEFDRPETHWDSALAEFLATKLGIAEGVETPEGIFMGQQYFPLAAGRSLGHPIPRIWFQGSFESLQLESKRPYCVWRGDRCDFEPWLRATDGETVLRPDLAWSLVDDELGFARVPVWASYLDYPKAAGGLVAEAPALLEFARRYVLTGRSDRLDSGNGSERVEPLEEVHGHNGSVAGGYATVLQLVGETVLRGFPPVVDGHMVDDFDHLQPRLIARPDQVDFVVAVNQNGDPRCTNRLNDRCSREYGLLANFVQFGLDRVDWAAVEAMVAGQRDEVVGMAIAGETAHFWFADDHHVAWDGPVSSFPGRVDAQGAELVSAEPYALPSTRIGPDVLGVALDPDGRVFAWYDDGRVSVGGPLDLSSALAPARFTVAEGHRPTDIVAVAMAGDGTVFAWYEDGTWSSGTASDVAAADGGAFDLPPGYEPVDIAAIAIERADDPALAGRVWTRFRDGNTLAGDVARLGTSP